MEPPQVEKGFLSRGGVGGLSPTSLFFLLEEGGLRGKKMVDYVSLFLEALVLFMHRPDTPDTEGIHNIKAATEIIRAYEETLREKHQVGL